MLEKYIKVEEREETTFQKTIKIFSGIATVIVVVAILIIGYNNLDKDIITNTIKSDKAMTRYYEEKAAKSNNVNNVEKVKNLIKDK